MHEVFETRLILNLDKSIDFKEEQQLNIQDISSSLEVLNEVIFNFSKEEQLWNKDDMLVTLLVLKEDKSNSFKE